jgi:hypothetical protein
MPNIKQKDERAPRSGDSRQTGSMERWRAASSSARSMSSTRSRSRCLHNGYHSCKDANILNTESEARWGNILSITILLRVVHKVQDIAANMNQKRRRLVPVWFAWVSKNSPRSRACQAGPRASWTKLHRNRAAGQVNIMWVSVSGIRITDTTRPATHVFWPPRPLKANDPVIIAIQRSLFSGVETPSRAESSKVERTL